MPYLCGIGISWYSIHTFADAVKCIGSNIFLKNGPTRPLFCLFSFFSITILQKNCRPQQIRTRIVGVEGEHADHLTTTTAQCSNIF